MPVQLVDGALPPRNVPHEDGGVVASCGDEEEEKLDTTVDGKIQLQNFSYKTRTL